MDQKNLDYCESLFKRYGLKFSLVRQRCDANGCSTTWKITGNINSHQALINQMMNDTRIHAYQF